MIKKCLVSKSENYNRNIFLTKIEDSGKSKDNRRSVFL